VTARKYRQLRTFIGLFAVVALVAASMLSAAPQPGPDARMMGQIGMSHGDHAGTMQMAAHNNKGLKKSAPCDNRDGTGDPNCCIGTVCPMSLAALGLVHDASEEFWIAPPSFISPPVILLTDRAHAAIFRPPIHA
jgi:hypothetical protein